MYGSEVLFIGKDFEMVQLSFLKNMLGVKRQTTSVAIYGDTGMYSLFVKQQILALKYWIRLISLPKSCYLKLHNCFVYFVQKINPWRMVFYFLFYCSGY